MSAVQRVDDARAWRWSEDRSANTVQILDAAIAAMRDGRPLSTWLLWRATGLTESEQRRYFPTEADLLVEVRDRVAREVVATACVDGFGVVRALTPWNVATALVDLAFNEERLYRALADRGLIEEALKPVGIVAATFRTFPRLSVHTDALYRRAADVAVIRAVLDQTLALDEARRPERYDVVEILDSFLTAVIAATAAS